MKNMAAALLLSATFNFYASTLLAYPGQACSSNSDCDAYEGTESCVGGTCIGTNEFTAKGPQNALAALLHPQLTVAMPPQKVSSIPAPVSDVQLVYKYTSFNGAAVCPCTLDAASVVTHGAEAQALYQALSSAFPKLVTAIGKLGLRPEIDLPNTACGIQVNSGGPSNTTTPSSEYQCYITVTPPQ